MPQIADNVTGDLFTGDAGALKKRILRVMTVSVVLAVAISSVIAPWRITTGLLLGGVLSLLNFRWLHSSVAAIFHVGEGQVPRARASRYLLRYLVMATAIFAAYKLNIVSLPATFAGLAAFVPALFAEASREFYFAIIHREESY